MELNVQILMLDYIDNQLINNRYKESVPVISSLTGMKIDAFERTRYRLNANQLCSLMQRKGDIIDSLHKLGVVSDEEWVKYMKSEDPKFTPRLNLNVL